MAVKIRRTYKGAAPSATLDSSGVSSTTQTAIILSTSPTNWPTGKFFVVVSPGTAQEEKMCVTLSGATLTTVDPNVTSTAASVNGRGVDDTTVRSSIAAGAVVYPVFTATDANEANELTSTYANQGGIVYQGASTFTQLGIGLAGQVMRVNSGATAPEWGQVATAGLADSSVTSAKIVDGTIVAADLASNSVTTVKIADSAVTSAKILDGTIVAGDLASNSVTTVKIADANVTTAKIADLNVTTGKIADLNVTTGKIADSAITSAKIADGTIVAADIASNAVTTIKILDANVTTAKIADSNVTTAKIADSAITSVKIADGTIVAADLASNSVTTVKITDANVTTAKIADANVTNAKLNNGASGDIPLVTVSSSAATGGKNGDIWIVV